MGEYVCIDLFGIFECFGVVGCCDLYWEFGLDWFGMGVDFYFVVVVGVEWL